MSREGGEGNINLRFLRDLRATLFRRKGVSPEYLHEWGNGLGFCHAPAIAHWNGNGNMIQLIEVLP